MNYFFVHFGEYPSWLQDSINSVKISDPESSIFLCGNSKETMHDIASINIDDIASEITKVAMQSSLWKHDDNPLWKTSLYRIFVILDMMNYLNIDEFVHFDSDVILFEKFENAKKSIEIHKNGLHITPCNDNELVFGYSYCNSKKHLNEICSLILKAMNDYQFLSSLIKDHPNEMQILSGIQKINPHLIIDLPTIPNKNYEYVFDPSSYGQYLYGTHNGYQPGWHGDHHRIGKLIGEKRLNVTPYPSVKFENNESKIVNLHIHSKNTKEVLNNGRYRL